MKPGDFGWSCDCEACRAARQQLKEHHPDPPMPRLAWWPKSTEQRYAEGWDRIFGKSK